VTDLTTDEAYGTSDFSDPASPAAIQISDPTSSKTKQIPARASPIQQPGAATSSSKKTNKKRSAADDVERLLQAVSAPEAEPFGLYNLDK
jgi:hypothetical protein